MHYVFYLNKDFFTFRANFLVMKKFLRFIVVLLVVIIIGVLILGLIAPKDFGVERTVAINAPKEVVAEQMLQYKNFKNWSPWQHMDSNMKSEIIGPELTAGTKYSWSGNDDVGSGEMVIKDIKGTELKYQMHFKEPWESEADGYWRVEDAGNGQSKAVWGFTTHSGFPWNGLMMVMGMEKMLAKDFDKGLNNLKAVSEKKAKEAPANDYVITETQFPGHTYASIRKTVAIDEQAMMKFFDESYQALAKAAGDRIIGSASCLAYNWDEKNKKADLAPAFPVKGTEPVKGATMATVAPSKAYMTVHNGDYSGFQKAHEAMGKHIAAKNVHPKLMIEEYLKGPGEEKDPKKWVTNIYYLVD
jgi:hypothetical protein